MSDILICQPSHGKKNYCCDECQGLDNQGTDGYFGYNSYAGYCDNPKCKESADRRERESITEDIYSRLDQGDITGALDACGDQDPMMFI